MEKNYIWIFTLEIFQSFPRSENSESSHRCCIHLKLFWVSQIFQVKHFFRVSQNFQVKHFFGRDPFFGVDLFLEETLFEWNKFFGGDALLRSFWEIELKICTHALSRVWKVLEHCIFQNFPKIPNNFQIWRNRFSS